MTETTDVLPSKDFKAFFNKLRDPSKEIRLAAISGILKRINTLEAQTLSEILVLEDLKTRGNDELSYSFTRLIRGLSSGQECARLGFSAALSEVLRLLPNIDIHIVLEEIKRATTPQSKAKGQEIRDHMLGRLAGMQALCTSERIRNGNINENHVKGIFTLLFELASSKEWLIEPCSGVALQYLDSMHTDIAATCAPKVYEMLCASKLEKTIEGIAITIKCAQCSPDLRLEGWKHNDVLHTKNLAKLTKILRDAGPSKDASSDAEDVDPVPYRNRPFKSELNFSWKQIVQAVVAASGPDHVQFAEFWRIAVDEGLFGTSASHQKKYWGFQLFDLLYEELPAEHIPTLLSPNLLRTLQNQSAREERFLNAAATKLIQHIIDCAQTQVDKVTTTVQSLLEHCISFDSHTKTKLIETLLKYAPSSSLKAIVQSLVSRFDCNDQVKISVKEVEVQRQLVVDYLLTLLKVHVKISGSWQTSIVDFLIINSFFTATKAKASRTVSIHEISSATREMLQARLTSSLSLLIPKLDNLGSTELAEPANFTRVVGTLTKYRTKKSYELVLKPDEELLNALELAEATLEELKSHSEQSNQVIAVQVLYSLAITQIYFGEADAIQNLEELNGCLCLVQEGAIEDSHEDPITVLTDILLSLLARDSVLYRKLGELVFAAFSEKLNESSMGLLLRVLTADENGQSLFDAKDNAEDDEDDDDDDDNDEEEAGNDEDEEMDEETESSSANEGSDSEDESETLSENERITQRDSALEAALETVLGNAANGKKRKFSVLEEKPDGEGHESDFEPDSDEDEELLDDDAMLAMDATLEDIFKRRKTEATSTKKKDRQRMRQSTVDFKRKVLDMLETFQRQRPSSPLILNMLEPLLLCSRKSSNQDFTKKIHVFMRKLTKPKDAPETSLSDEELTDLLVTMHVEAKRSQDPPQLGACSQAAFLVARVILSRDGSRLNDIVQVWARSQVTWMQQKNSNFSTTFFSQFLNWCTQWRENTHKLRSS